MGILRRLRSLSMGDVRLTVAGGLLIAAMLGVAPGKTQATEIRDVSVNDAIAYVRQHRGEVVMFHLYASWCGPCRREFPDVNRLGMEYAGKGFVLLAFSVDQDTRSLIAFLGDNQYSFSPMRIIGEQPGMLATAVRSVGGNYQNAIPYTAIFDRSGTLVREWSGSNAYATYAGVIEQLLARAPSRTSGRLSPAPAPSGGFEVRENNLLKFAERKTTMNLLTRDGKVPSGPSDAAIFMIGSRHSDTPIADRRKFAEQRLMSTGSTINVSITEARDVKIDELDGYEFVADAVDTDINKPIIIYQTILFNGDRYYVMQGFGKLEEKQSCLDAFRSVARSFKRK